MHIRIKEKNNKNKMKRLKKNVGEDAGKKEPSYMLVGMQVSATTLENNMEA
jgi:hypothetical protein